MQIDKVRIILLEEFIKAQEKNPSFSMRAYAQRIGVPQAAVSQILAGKRALTLKTARKILQGLNRDPDEIALLTETGSKEISTFRSVDMETFRAISDWYHFAIMSLAETADFKSDSKWISSRLNISETIAEEAIERLIALGMLERSGGKLLSTGEQFEAISTIANPALRKANAQNLELIADALHCVPVSERDFTAITLCFDPDRIEDARKMIKNFRRDFSKVMESGKKKEVYKMCIQLFPLTRRAK